MGWGRQVQLEISYLNVKPMSFVTGSARIAKADIDKREKHTNSQSANTSVNTNGIVLHTIFWLINLWMSGAVRSLLDRECVIAYKRRRRGSRTPR